MKAEELTSPALNEQQVLMLRLLKNPLPPDDFTQIRRLATQLLAKQLDAIINDWEKQNSITEEYYESLAETHLRVSKKS